MGGSLPTADPANAVLTHADGTKQTIDLSHPEKKSDDPEVNVVLQPGDVIYIPEQQGKISVVGEVKQPGSIYYKENTNVLDAIASSGGINQDTADLDNSTLTHNGVAHKLDLRALYNKGDLSKNEILSSGDIISIPELHNRVYVYGDVGRPGYYYYKPGDRLADAFSSAAVSPDADLNKVNLVHVSPGQKSRHPGSIQPQRLPAARQRQRQPGGAAGRCGLCPQTGPCVQAGGCLRATPSDRLRFLHDTSSARALSLRALI